MFEIKTFLFTHTKNPKSPLPQIKTISTHTHTHKEKTIYMKKLNCAVFVTLKLIENEHVANGTPQSP